MLPVAADVKVEDADAAARLDHHRARVAAVPAATEDVHLDLVRASGEPVLIRGHEIDVLHPARRHVYVQGPEVPQCISKVELVAAGGLDVEVQVGALGPAEGDDDLALNVPAG